MKPDTLVKVQDGPEKFVSEKFGDLSKREQCIYESGYDKGYTHAFNVMLVLIVFLLITIAFILKIK